MIDDDDLTIDGADLMAEILAAKETSSSSGPDDASASAGPLDNDPVVDVAGEDATVTQSPLGSSTQGASTEALASSERNTGARWRPPPGSVPVVAVAPTVGGMSRLQLGIVVGVVALGVAMSLAIGLARSRSDRLDDEPATAESTLTFVPTTELGE